MITQQRVVENPCQIHPIETIGEVVANPYHQYLGTIFAGNRSTSAKVNVWRSAPAGRLDAGAAKTDPVEIINARYPVY